MMVGATAGFAGAFVLDKLTAVNDYDLIGPMNEIEQRLNLPLLASIPIIEPSKIINVIPVSRRFALPSAFEEEQENNQS